MAEDRTEKGVKSLNVALDVMEAVAAAEEDVGVTELAARLGLTKPTVFRHLQTLVERNYIVQNNKTARYRLGIQCQLLAETSGSRVDLRSASEEVVTWLRDETGLSVVLSAVRARSIVVLATLLARSPLQLGVRPGSELPLHSSAQGYVALAFGPRSLASFAKKQSWEATTRYTSTGWEAVEVKIARAQGQGWIDAPEEMALGLNGAAAPIFDDRGECVGAIAVVGLIQNLPHEVDPRVTRALLAAAERVSANLGHTVER